MAKNVTYVNETDIMEKQAAAEKQMLDEFKKGEFTLENPLVKLNPYLVSPCAAVVLFRTEKDVAVTITVLGKEKEGNITHTFPKAKEHILPVLGLYPDYENTVEIRLYRGAAKTVTLKTGPLASSVPPLLKMDTTAGHLRDNVIIVSPAVSGALTGFDYKGDVRWYISIPMQMDIKRLRNGRLLAGSHRLIRGPYHTTGLYEFDAVGKIYKEFLIPGGYHHDQIEMENGDLVVLSNDFGRDTVEDLCVLVDRQTGAIKKTWDYKSFFTPGEGKSGKHTEEDWFHNNAVWYDKNTNSLTLSGRHVDAMVNIDYDTGALNWVIGDPETWPQDKQKYFFKPVGGDTFGWQYAQHAAVITPNGDVMCFDNGTLRSKVAQNYVLNRDNFSRAVRYSINTDDMTIRQVWEFGREMGSDFFSQHISNVEYYSDGHYLIHSGGKQFYDDIPHEDLLPHGDDPRARREGVTLEVVNDEIVLEMRIEGNYYRAEKLPLYSSGANLELGEGKKLGSAAATKPMDAPPPVQSAGESVPESHMAHIVEESDRISLKARFAQGVDAALLLKGKDVRCYRVDTENYRHAMLAGQDYIPEDETNTSTTVNKLGLDGAYNVSIIIDGVQYDTGVVVNG